MIGLKYVEIINKQQKLTKKYCKTEDFKGLSNKLTGTASTLTNKNRQTSVFIITLKTKDQTTQNPLKTWVSKRCETCRWSKASIHPSKAFSNFLLGDGIVAKTEIQATYVDSAGRFQQTIEKFKRNLSSKYKWLCVKIKATVVTNVSIS